MERIRPFFLRQKDVQNDFPTEFQTNIFSQKLKTQVLQVLLNNSTYGMLGDIHKAIKFLREDYGLFTLDGLHHGDSPRGYLEELQNAFFKSGDISLELSILEYIFRILMRHGLSNEVKQCNRYMREDGFGYRFNLDEQLVVQLEDETFYMEVTQGTLSILGQNRFAEARKNYHGAYEELKKGKLDKAITDCCKALESVLKVRLLECGCSEKDVKDANISHLLKRMGEHIVVPPYMAEYLNNFKGIFQAVGTARNKDGGHGSVEGQDPSIDERFVRFIINQTASNILFIAEADFKSHQGQE